MRSSPIATVPAALLALASAAVANDVIFLNGQVHLQDGAPPGHSVEIKLSCPGSEPVRQTTSNKKGGFFLKVERDDFNHIARTLPSISMDVRSEPMAGSCRLIGVLKGYQSSEIDLSTFVIGKDLKLPELVLHPSAH